MSETMTDDSDLLARIGGYLAARPQYARTFYADHPEVMLKEAVDALGKLREDRDCLKLLSDEQAVDQSERRAEITQLQDELAKLRAENERLAEDLRLAVISDNEYCKALEVEGARLQAENERMKRDLAEHGGRYWEARYRDEAAESERLRATLRMISLASFDEATTKERLGQEARAALTPPSPEVR